MMNWWQPIYEALVKKEPEPRTEPCPKCGTMDCITSEEYRKHIKIGGAGQLSVDSKILTKSCKFRQQLIQAKQIVEHTRKNLK